MAIKKISSQSKIKIKIEECTMVEVGVLYGIKISIDIKCNLLEQFFFIPSKYDQFKTIHAFLFCLMTFKASPYYYYTSNYCVRKNNKLSYIVIHSSIILQQTQDECDASLLSHFVVQFYAIAEHKK